MKPPKNKLTAGEKKKIISTIEVITGKFDVESICAYGSRISGYAKPESDYDLIISIRNYTPKVRYRYISDSIDVSAILVNSKSLLSDAKNASLGDFVAGRFLNPYETIAGGEIFNEIEYIYKKRVALETINELISEYQNFTEDLIIPVEYLLFERLRKRASLYPPALYSYAKTYGRSVGKENLRRSCETFISALEELDREEEMINLEGRVLRLGGSRRNQLGKIQTAISVTQRGIRHYAVHGYAGRVRPSIVRKELFAKMSRARGSTDIPNELKYPKSLLSIEDGVLMIEDERWINRFLENIGLRDADVVTKRVGGSTTLFTIAKDGMEKQFLAKKFRSTESMRQIVSSIAKTSKVFEFTPLSRLHKEYSSTRLLNGKGIDVAKIRAVILPQRIIVRDFVSGQNLSVIVKDRSQRRNTVNMELLPLRSYGQILAKIHVLGFALGDPKPTNAISSEKDGRIFLTDLESMIVGGDPFLDLSVFLQNTIGSNIKSETSRMIVRSILDGYLEDVKPEKLEEMLRSKYLLPFRENISHFIE